MARAASSCNAFAIATFYSLELNLLADECRPSVISAGSWPDPELPAAVYVAFIVVHSLVCSSESDSGVECDVIKRE